MATKKQVNDLENVVLVLEERLEKMEEDHAMLKQMMSMQNVLIENLQMMVKMMSTNTNSGAPSTTSAYRVMHIGGESQVQDDNTHAVSATATQLKDEVSGLDQTEEEKRPLRKADKRMGSISELRHRMSRIV